MKYLSPWLIEMGLAKCKQDRNQFLYHPQCRPSLNGLGAHHVSLDFAMADLALIVVVCLPASLGPSSPHYKYLTLLPHLKLLRILNRFGGVCVFVCFKMIETVCA